MGEVQAQSLVRQSQYRSWRSRASSVPEAASSPDRLAFLAIKQLVLHPVDHHAFPSKQDMQTAIADPPPLAGQFAQLLAQTGIIVPDGTVAHTLAIGIDETARPPFAHPVAGLEMSNSFRLAAGVIIFLPEDPSVQLGPASYRPATA